MAISGNVWKLLSGGSTNIRRRSFYSAWIKCSEGREEEDSAMEVERIFTRNDIQCLLRSLTGIDLQRKIFCARRIKRPQRAHYALMTDQAYHRTVKSMQDISVNFLQFVPVLEPRCSTPFILAKDPEIEGFDDSKYVFTDLSFGLGVQVRSVVVRETDGTLRSGTPEERDRMTRVYKGHPYRPIYEPPLFRDPYLQMALDRDDHEHVLDWACHYYQPNDPVFIKLCHTVFDRTVDTNKFGNLHSTRHFGPFVFYLVINKKFPPLLSYYAAEERTEDAANLIRLIKAIFPDEAWSYRMGDADNLEILEEYAKENTDCKATINDLINTTKRKQERNQTDASVGMEFGKERTEHSSTMDKESFASTEGPLGEMAKDYGVRVIRGSVEAIEQTQKLEEKSTKRRNRQNPKGSKK